MQRVFVSLVLAAGCASARRVATDASFTTDTRTAADVPLDARTDATTDVSEDGAVDARAPQDANPTDVPPIVDAVVLLDSTSSDSGPRDAGARDTGTTLPDTFVCIPDRMRCGATPATCCSGVCNVEGYCGPPCLPDTRLCDNADQCCSLECNVDGACGPRTCEVDGERCFHPRECCTGSCTDGYCGTTPIGMCRNYGIDCWDHSQCCSGHCGGGNASQPGGRCVNIEFTPGTCFPGGNSCFFSTDCCSESCRGGICDLPERGPWPE